MRLTVCGGGGHPPSPQQWLCWKGLCGSCHPWPPASGCRRPHPCISARMQRNDISARRCLPTLLTPKLIPPLIESHANRVPHIVLRIFVNGIADLHTPGVSLGQSPSAPCPALPCIIGVWRHLEVLHFHCGARRDGYCGNEQVQQLDHAGSVSVLYIFLLTGHTICEWATSSSRRPCCTARQHTIPPSASSPPAPGFCQWACDFDL